MFLHGHLLGKPRYPCPGLPFAMSPADQFITLLSGTAVGLPLAAGAQQAGRTYRLGVLHNLGPQSPQFPPFYDELRRLGFVEGQNLIVDSRTLRRSRASTSSTAPSSRNSSKTATS